MNAILTLAAKDLRLLLRDRGNAFFTFVFPLILAIFFGLVFGGSKPSAIEIALVREDGSKLGAAIAADLMADASFAVEVHATRESASEAVRAGRLSAAVILPAGMDDDLGNLLGGRGIRVEAVIDPSRKAEAGLLQGKLNELVFRQFPRIFADREQSARFFTGVRRGMADSRALSPEQKLLASGMLSAGESFLGSMRDASKEGSPSDTRSSASWSPVAVEVEEIARASVGPRSSFDISLPQGLVWGLAGCVTAFASSIVTERARGTLARLRLAPMTSAHLVLGKALACFVAAIAMQAILMLVAVLVLGVSIAQPGMVALACMASAFAFTGLTMLLAGLCRTEGAAQGAGRGAVLILALIGGGSVPLFFMPPLLREVSVLSPFLWVVTAIEGPFWRDLPASDQLKPLLVLVAIGIIGLLAGVRAVSRPRWA